MDRDEYLFLLESHRGILESEICETCQGFGTILYSNTSTWRGGIGGAAMTMDVCDKCWGSGNKYRPWPSHREYYEMKKYFSKRAKMTEKELNDWDY